MLHRHPPPRDMQRTSVTGKRFRAYRPRSRVAYIRLAFFVVFVASFVLLRPDIRLFRPPPVVIHGGVPIQDDVSIHEHKIALDHSQMDVTHDHAPESDDVDPSHAAPMHDSAHISLRDRRSKHPIFHDQHFIIHDSQHPSDHEKQPIPGRGGEAQGDTESSNSGTSKDDGDGDVQEPSSHTESAFVAANGFRAQQRDDQDPRAEDARPSGNTLPEKVARNAPLADDGVADDKDTDDANADDANADDANADDAHADDTNEDDANVGDTNADDTNAGDTNADDTKSDEMNADDTNADDKNADDTNADDSNADDSNVDDANADDTNAEDANAGDANAGDANAGDTNADDTNADDTNDDDTIADDTNADDTNADDTNAGDTNADDTNADDTNADDTNAGDTNADDTNADNANTDKDADDTPVNDERDDGMLADRASVDEKRTEIHQYGHLQESETNTGNVRGDDSQFGDGQENVDQTIDAQSRNNQVGDGLESVVNAGIRLDEGNLSDDRREGVLPGGEVQSGDHQTDPEQSEDGVETGPRVAAGLALNTQTGLMRQNGSEINAGANTPTNGSLSRLQQTDGQQVIGFREQYASQSEPSKEDNVQTRGGQEDEMNTDDGERGDDQTGLGEKDHAEGATEIGNGHSAIVLGSGDQTGDENRNDAHSSGPHENSRSPPWQASVELRQSDIVSPKLQQDFAPPKTAQRVLPLLNENPHRENYGESGSDPGQNVIGHMVQKQYLHGGELRPAQHDAHVANLNPLQDDEAQPRQPAGSHVVLSLAAQSPQKKSVESQPLLGAGRISNINHQNLEAQALPPQPDHQPNRVQDTEHGPPNVQKYLSISNSLRRISENELENGLGTDAKPLRTQDDQQQSRIPSQSFQQQYPPPRAPGDQQQSQILRQSYEQENSPPQLPQNPMPLRGDIGKQKYDQGDRNRYASYYERQSNPLDARSMQGLGSQSEVMRQVPERDITTSSQVYTSSDMSTRTVGLKDTIAPVEVAESMEDNRV